MGGEKVHVGVADLFAPTPDIQWPPVGVRFIRLENGKEDTVSAVQNRLCTQYEERRRKLDARRYPKRQVEEVLSVGGVILALPVIQE